jgi:xanthine/CO dehydrogenase XdhC/CoxF family maturation factor
MRISGIEPPLDSPLPQFAGGPVTVLVSRAGDCATVLTERQHRTLAEHLPGSVHTYASSPNTALAEPALRYLAAGTQALHAFPARGRLAIEPRYTPAHALRTASEFSSSTVSVEDAWEDACAVKLESTARRAQL